jgi:hypothetical protein
MADDIYTAEFAIKGDVLYIEVPKAAKVFQISCAGAKFGGAECSDHMIVRFDVATEDLLTVKTGEVYVVLTRYRQGKRTPWNPMSIMKGLGDSPRVVTVKADIPIDKAWFSETAPDLE